jgi:hypothetical protein
VSPLTANQELLLLLMVDEDRWWTAACIRVVWPVEVPKGGLGMSLRGLWSRGLADRVHGPPTAFHLNDGGRKVAAEIRDAEVPG